MALIKGDNPYVGPRTFKTVEKVKFFGRNREARDLTALIVSNKLSLFYAPSGAGKSSLLNTMIRPMLENEGFEVLPTGRVSGYSGQDIFSTNIYIYNLLLSLQQSEKVVANFESLTLSHFLDNLVQDEAGTYCYNPDYSYPADSIFKPRVLIVDQFEEMVTTNAALWEQRTDFFVQIAEALQHDEHLWIVLTLREDFIAHFDQYSYLTPNRLRQRYRMERLRRDAALQAIQMPVENSRPFDSDAVEQLVDNLRRIRTNDAHEKDLFEEFVEPVQLQAVCYQMWEKLSHVPGATITVDDVTQYADVDTALINFYEDTIKKTVVATGVSEVDLRAWFDRELITDAGTRNTVFRGEATTGGLQTSIADYVRQQFILSEVVRPGGAWYELVHDRFVSPIVAANNTWRQEQPLIQLAQGWENAGRPEELLLSGPQLEQLGPTGWQSLGSLVNDYVNAARSTHQTAQKAEQARELEQQRQRAEESQQAANRQYRLTKLLTVVSFVAVIAAVIALFFWNDAQQQVVKASEARAIAEISATRANAAVATAAFEAKAAIAARSTSDARGVSLVDSLATQESQIVGQLSPTPVPTNSTTVPGATQTSATPDVSMQATTESLNQQLGQVRATQMAIAQELLAENIETSIIGYSVQGKPIEVTQIGSGSDKIVFVGGIHSGTAPSTVTLGEATIDYFRQFIEEIPQSVTLFVVPNMNPDSVPRTNDIMGRYNANGVDLNRNWNCNWTSDPIIRGKQRENAGGIEPNSEPETQALASFLLEQQPVAVIFWDAPDLTTSIFPGGCPYIKPETQELAGLYARASGYNEVKPSGNSIEGDASNWLDYHDIPSIFVLLPSATDPDFERNLDGIKHVIQHYAQP